MRRREFLGFLGSSPVALWASGLRAQQPGGSRRIAVLMGSATTELGKSYLATFL